MVGTLKTLQLLTSMAVIALFWIIYPGTLLVMATGIGLCYVLLAVGAVFDFRPAIWLAFLFSALTALLSGYGVYRYVVNGFDFMLGRFPNQASFYAVPYLFLLVALSSLLVVAMHVGSWRWMVSGGRARAP